MDLEYSTSYTFDRWRQAVDRRTRRRISAGLCGFCSYDLRASGARCSECGTAVEPA